MAIYLRIAYIDLSIDHSDYSSPIKTYIKSEAFQISPSFYPRFFYYFQKFSYFNDVGYFSKELENIIGYKFEKFSEIYSLINPFIVPEAFSLFSITLTSNEEIFVRSYQKIHNLIANLGGLVKGIVLIGECVLVYFSKKSLFVHYANSIFNYQKPVNSKSVLNTKLSMNLSNHVNNVNLNKTKNFHTTGTVNNDSQNQNLNLIQNKNFQFKKIEISNITQNNKKQILRLKKRQDKYLDRGVVDHQSNQLNLNNSINELKNTINSKLKIRKIKMTLKEIICLGCIPRFIKDAHRVKFYMRSEKFIRQILSMENVLHVLTQFDLLKIILLNEKKLTVFNNLPKISLDEHERILNNRMSHLNNSTNKEKLLECISTLNKEKGKNSRLVNYFTEDI